MATLRIRENYLSTVERFFENLQFRESIEPENRRLYWNTYVQFWENWQQFRRLWQFEKIEDSGGHKLVLFPKNRRVVFKLFRYLPEDFELEKKNYDLLVKHGHGKKIARTRFYRAGYAVSQRVQPLNKRDRIPRRLLDLFQDESRENFGWLNGRIVAVDFDYIAEDIVIDRGKVRP